MTTWGNGRTRGLLMMTVHGWVLGVGLVNLAHRRMGLVGEVAKVEVEHTLERSSAFVSKRTGCALHFLSVLARRGRTPCPKRFLEVDHRVLDLRALDDAELTPE